MVKRAGKPVRSTPSARMRAGTMIWDMRTSIASLRQDVSRWRKDLAMFEAAGLGRSSAAETVRGWIACVEDLIAHSKH